MKLWIPVIAGLLLIGGTQTTDKKRDIKPSLYVSNYENVLGTSLEFKVTSTSEQDAERAEIAALNEIKRLSGIFSAYDTKSEFSRWMNADLNKAVKVSKELFDMLTLFKQWHNRTNGALNSSAEVASKLWADAARSQKTPTSAALSNAVRQMQQDNYRLDETNFTVTRLSNVPLVLNTFAKSYIVNMASDAALRSPGITSVVVNIGGDLVIKGDETDLVNVTNPLANAENDTPLAYLKVGNRAIATSGNYRRGVQIGKHWYSHIIDPRTAKPVEHIISATIIAPKAIDAGALATAFNVMSVAESKALAASVDSVEYLIVTAAGKVIESKGWHKFVNSAMQSTATKVLQPLTSSAEKLWDPKFELLINFEFNTIAGNGHRPFAAIWVEDANKVAVRNLALWYNKPKWIPDLRNWYRINGERFKADKSNYASVTGATRSPGKYTVKWDGKNDKGEYVPQGKYTIIIETSKEHGTDEILRQELELKKSPKKAASAGNVEISKVSFDFRKK